MEIQEKILAQLSIYGKENRYRLARALKIDVEEIAKVLKDLEKEGVIEIKSGNAVIVKRKKSITINARKSKVEVEKEKPKEESKEIKDEPSEEGPKERKLLENKFVFADGRMIKNLRELADTLETMSDDIYRHHVNEFKNDFSNWVRDIFHNYNLAEKISKTKNKMETKMVILKSLRKEVPETFDTKIEVKRLEGTIKFYDPDRSFGFIIGNDGKEYYVHKSALKEGVAIESGDRVSFKVVQGEKGPKAEEVEWISQA